MNLINDCDVWEHANPRDLWVHDRFILAKMMGYYCGTVDTPIEIPGEYVVKPAINPLGCGVGATLMTVPKRRAEIPLRHQYAIPGHFWMQKFEGEHISVDYYLRGGRQRLTVRGVKHPHGGYPVSKWLYWEKVDVNIPMPDVFFDLVGDYAIINCEFIGGRLIEAHLRRNPDFDPFPDADVAMPLPSEIHALPIERDKFKRLKWVAAPDDGSRLAMMYGWWR